MQIDLPLICFEVACSAGTYIRTLGADIGKSLGCGGHLHQLKRVASSGFTLDQATPLSEVAELARTRKLAAPHDQHAGCAAGNARILRS